MAEVIVIGAGFAGLSAAACLAQQGHQVSVFEKNSSPGGRARKFEEQGFVFDMGPSWYWMPDVFESFYQRFHHTSSDFYDLRRLDPSYRIFFSEKDIMDVPAEMPELEGLFENREPGSSVRLRKFLAEAKFKYETGIKNLVYKPGLSITELFDKQLLSGLFRLDVFQSMSSHVRKYFKDPGLIQLLEFPVLFLGASPSETPALYSLMNYADMALGTWYPMGGMSKISDAMFAISKNHGVKFHFNAEVNKISVSEGKADSVQVNGRSISCDFVVAGADYHHVDHELLENRYRNYSEDYWQKRVMAPSSLIFYLGVNKRISALHHHNLFFDQDFQKHTAEIYHHPTWPSNPLFYLCCPSKTDPTVAPSGMENLFILIPAAAGLDDDEPTRERYFNLVMQRLERLTGESIRPHVIYKRSYAHRDFISDYHAFRGNAYGLANTMRQTANLKPSIINKNVSNLFYTGQLTVPGPGVPPAIISGQVAATQLQFEVNKQNKKKRN